MRRLETFEEKRSKVEVIKEQSHYLRGTIAEALQDGTSHFSEENIQVLKFHGTYQQDDRDLRKKLRQEGKERHYMMMVRARIPGGVLSANQYLEFDRLSEEYGNHTMRITTRQTFQLHGILKGNLKATIRGINESLLTTLGGCGDQIRNTIGCAAPHTGPFYEAVRADLIKLVDELAAKTNAYHEIWLDGEKVDLTAERELTDEDHHGAPAGESSRPQGTTVEPLYGRTYLPRKFKLAFAYEGDNCADIYSNDIGIVAHKYGDEVEGYTLVIGGGMGRTATDKETHPSAAKPFAFVSRDELVDTCRAIVEVQRDFGNRADRKFARMKYLVEDKGIEWFREQVSGRLNRELSLPRELVWHSAADHLGWHSQDHGHGFLGIFVENGRIQDTDSVKLKTVLREIMKEFQPTVHLTTQQNMILANLTEDVRQKIEAKLEAAGIRIAERLSKVRKNAMACVALPTCGLAIAESERVFPKLMPKFEEVVQELGLEDEDISIRMTGCPNGCARPYIAEIGFVGRVIGKYDVFLGASPNGMRTNTLFREMVPFDDLVDVVKPVLAAFARERELGERFGDFCHRIDLERFRDLVGVTR